MKLLLAFLLTFSAMSSFASDCKEAHLGQAFNKGNTQFAAHGFKYVGGIWVVSGLVAISAGAAPITAIVLGGALITTSVVKSIQEPRYKMISKLIFSKTFDQDVKLFEDKTFQKVLAEAQEINPEFTEAELADALYAGIETGDFCKENGKPYSFMKMKKAVLSNL